MELNIDQLKITENEKKNPKTINTSSSSHPTLNDNKDRIERPQLHLKADKTMLYGTYVYRQRNFPPYHMEREFDGFQMKLDGDIRSCKYSYTPPRPRSFGLDSTQQHDHDMGRHTDPLIATAAGCPKCAATINLVKLAQQCVYLIYTPHDSCEAQREEAELSFKDIQAEKPKLENELTETLKCCHLLCEHFETYDKVSDMSDIGVHYYADVDIPALPLNEMLLKCVSVRDADYAFNYMRQILVQQKVSFYSPMSLIEKRAYALKHRIQSVTKYADIFYLRSEIRALYGICFQLLLFLEKQQKSLDEVVREFEFQCESDDDDDDGVVIITHGDMQSLVSQAQKQTRPQLPVTGQHTSGTSMAKTLNVVTDPSNTLTPTSEQRTNVIYYMQNTAKVGNVEHNQTYNGTIRSAAELPWSINTLLEKPVPFSAFSWQTSDTAGQTLRLVAVPAGQYNSEDDQVSNLLSNFTFIETGMNLKFVESGTSFAQGILRAWYNIFQTYPRILATATMNGGIMPGHTHVMDHVDILPKEKGSAEITLPFVWNNPMLPLLTPPNEGDVSPMFTHCGTVVVDVWSPLYNISNLPVEIGLQTNLKDPKLYAPTNRHNLPILSIRQGGARDYDPAVVRNVQFQSEEQTDDTSDEPEQTSVVDSAGDWIKDKLGGIPVIGGAINNGVDSMTALYHGDFGTWVKKGTQAGLAILGSILHRPLAPGHRLRHGELPYMYNTFGAIQGSRLGDFPISMVVDPSFIQGMLPHYTITNIAQKYSGIQLNIQMGTTDDINTVLASGPLFPFYFLWLGDNVTGRGFISDSFAMSMARCFDRWRGGLKFKIQIVNQENHAGQICFQYTYLHTTADHNVPSISSAYKHYFQLGGSNVFEVKVPYISAFQWCDRPDPEHYWIAGYSDFSKFDKLNFEQMLGSWKLSVSQRLTRHTTQVPEVIKLNIFMAMDEDCEFSNYVGPLLIEEWATRDIVKPVENQENWSVWKPQTATVYDAVFQSEGFGVDHTSTTLTNAPPATEWSRSLTDIGPITHDNFSSLILDYMKVPTPIDELLPANGKVLTYIVPMTFDPLAYRRWIANGTYVQPPQGQSVPPYQLKNDNYLNQFPQSHQGHFGQMFAGWRGSQRLWIQLLQNMNHTVQAEYVYCHNPWDLQRYFDGTKVTEAQQLGWWNPFVVKAEHLRNNTDDAFFSKRGTLYTRGEFTVSHENPSMLIEIPYTQKQQFLFTVPPQDINVYTEEGDAVRPNNTYPDDETRYAYMNGFVMIRLLANYGASEASPVKLRVLYSVGDDYTPVIPIAPRAWFVTLGSLGKVGSAWATRPNPPTQYGQFETRRPRIRVMKALTQSERNEEPDKAIPQMMSDMDPMTSATSDFLCGTDIYTDYPYNETTPSEIKSKPWKTVLREIKDTPSKIQKTFDNMDEKMSELSDKITHAVEPFETTFQKADKVMDKITDFLGLKKGEFDIEEFQKKSDLLQLGSLSNRYLYIIINFISRKSIYLRLLDVTEFLLESGLAWITRDQITTLITQYSDANQSPAASYTTSFSLDGVDRDIQFQAESGVSHSMNWVQATGFLSGLAAMTVTGSVDKTEIVDKKLDLMGKRMSNLASLNRGVEGCMALFRHIIAFFKACIEYYLDHFTTIPRVEQFQQYQAKYERFIQLMETMNQADASIMAESDVQYIYDIYWLEDTYRELQGVLSRLPVKDVYQLRNTLTSYAQRLEKLKTIARTAKMSSDSRIDPCCFWLYGPPGVGKSSYGLQLSKILAAEMNVTGPNAVYHKPVNEGYWSRYCHSVVTFIDDMTQPLQTNPDTSIYLQFMYLNSNSPLILPMADVSEKGRHFTSQALVITDNKAMFNGAGLQEQVRDPLAFARRRNVVAEFRNRLGDLSRKTEVVDADDAIEIQLHHPINGDNIGSPMSWKEFVKYARMFFKVHIKNQKEILQRLVKECTVNLEELTDEDYYRVGLTPPGKSGVAMTHPTWENIYKLDKPAVIYADRHNPEAMLSGVRAYRHYGVLLPDGQILHIEPSMNDNPTFKLVKIRITNEWGFAQNSPVFADDYGALLVEQLDEEPTSTFEERYNLIKDLPFMEYSISDSNCEHLANWLCHGLRFSRQTQGNEMRYYINHPPPTTPPQFADHCKPQAIDNGNYLSVAYNVMKQKITMPNQPMTLPDGTIHQITGDELEESKISPLMKIANYAKTSGLDCYVVRQEIAQELTALLSSPSTLPKIKIAGTLVQSVFGGPDMEYRETLVWLDSKINTVKGQAGFCQKINMLWQVVVAKLRSWWNEFKTKHPRIFACLKWCSIAIAIVVAATACWGLYSLFKKADQDAEIEMQGKDYQKGQTKQLTRKSNRPVIRVANAVTQKAIDQATIDIEENALPKYMAYIRFVTKSDRRQLSAGPVVRSGELILMPRHYLEGVYDEWVAEFSSPKRQETIELQEEDFDFVSLDGTSDILVTKLPPQIEMAPDISKLLYTDDDLNYIPRDVFMSISHWTPSKGFDKKSGYGGLRRKVATDDDSYYTNAIAYKIETLPGDCGSIATVHNSKNPRKVLGFHIAKSPGGLAYSVILTQELYQKLYEASGAPKAADRDVANFQSELASPNTSKIPAIEPKGDFTMHGIMSKPIFINDKTQIRPSPLHACFPVQTAPAILKKSDMPAELKGVDPMTKSINKYHKPLGKWNIPILETVFDEVAQVIIRDYPALRTDVGFRTFHEAINGNEHYAHYEKLDLTTSPGYPFTQQKRFIALKGEDLSGKKCLFTGEYPNWVPKPILAEKLNADWNDLMNGIRPDWTWQACLKDERRPIAKVQAGNTRTFCIGDVSSTILGRCAFMDLIAAITDKPTKSFSGVGIDCHGPDWTELYHRLKEKGSHGFDTDYTNFDGSIHPRIMLALADIANRWYMAYGTTETTKTQLARHIIMQDVTHATQIAKNVVIQKHQGNPSGFFMTTIGNTIVGMIYLRYAWKILCERTNNIDLKPDFDEFVAVCIYGDDNIQAVDPEVSSWYNQSSVAAVLSECGVTMTSADKVSALSSNLQPIEDLTFLKCGFKPHPRYPECILSPIDPRTITELPMWIKTDIDQIAQTKSNIRDCLRFAYHHGPTFYNNIRMRITACANQRGYHQLVPTTTYGDEDREFLAKFGIVTKVGNMGDKEVKEARKPRIRLVAAMGAVGQAPASDRLYPDLGVDGDTPVANYAQYVWGHENSSVK